MASTVFSRARRRREEPEQRREQRGSIEGVRLVVLAQDARSLTPWARMSARISSAVARHLSCEVAGRPRSSASFAARSSATQHISLDDT